MCLSAGPLQDSRGCSIYQHTAADSSFITNWQLAPAGLHSDLVTVDANWHRLNLLTYHLTVDARVQKHKHRFEYDLDSCHPPSTLEYTAYKQYRTGSACCVYLWPTKRHSSPQLMLGRSRRRNPFTKIFKKQPYGNMMNIAKMTLRTLFAANWKLSMTVPVFLACPSSQVRATHGLPRRAP